MGNPVSEPKLPYRPKNDLFFYNYCYKQGRKVYSSSLEADFDKEYEKNNKTAINGQKRESDDDSCFFAYPCSMSVSI
jgi:hypothetical protein